MVTRGVNRRAVLAGATAAATGVATGVRFAHAADPVKVGVLFPLTGNAAAAGQASKAAVELAIEIVNNPNPDLKQIPLAEGTGLPGLGGAKIELTFIDHQGNPSVAQQQALRLISQDKVHAMFGAYQSSCTLTATPVAERNGIPFMIGDSAAGNITERGFKTLFRTTPIASDFADAYMRFFADMNKAGNAVKSVAVVNENTDYGTSVGDAVEAAAKKAGFTVTNRIPYSASSTDVSAQVLQMKDKNPDVVIFISYTADAILYMKTMQNLDFMPRMVLGDDSGFSDPSFVPAVKDIAKGVMNRSAWDIGKPGSHTAKINAMYKAKTGRDLDDTSGRNMQGMLTLAEGINRAGSTAPDKIIAALRATDLKPEQLMMGYRGVKFDDKGQNILASTYLIQLNGGEYKVVWPEANATDKLVWPMKGWK